MITADEIAEELADSRTLALATKVMGFKVTKRWLSPPASHCRRRSYHTMADDAFLRETLRQQMAWPNYPSGLATLNADSPPYRYSLLGNIFGGNLFRV